MPPEPCRGSSAHLPTKQTASSFIFFEPGTWMATDSFFSKSSLLQERGDEFNRFVQGKFHKRISHVIFRA